MGPDAVTASSPTGMALKIGETLPSVASIRASMGDVRPVAQASYGVAVAPKRLNKGWGPAQQTKHHLQPAIHPNTGLSVMHKNYYCVYYCV